MESVDKVMKDLAEYTRLLEETQMIVDELKESLKRHMEANGLEVLQGVEHKATYKAVTQKRIDGAALKEALPEIAAEYTKETTYKRFLFV